MIFFYNNAKRTDVLSSFKTFAQRQKKIIVSPHLHGTPLRNLFIKEWLSTHMIQISKEISLSYFQKNLHNNLNEIFNKRLRTTSLTWFEKPVEIKKLISVELRLYHNVDLERKKQYFLLFENWILNICKILSHLHQRTLFAKFWRRRF